MRWTLATALTSSLVLTSPAMSRTCATSFEGNDQVQSSLREIYVAGMGAGEKNNYVPPKDDRLIAATKIAGGDEETTIGFDPSVSDVGGIAPVFAASPDTARSCSES